MELLQGDCLDILKHVPDCSVDMVLTDPPYGTTSCAWDCVIPLPLMWQHLSRVTKTNGAILLFASQPFTSVLGASNREHLRYHWIWQKHHATGHLNAKKRPMKIEEEILVFYAEQPTYNPQGTVAVDWSVTNSDSDCRRGKGNETSTVSGGLKKAYKQTATNYPRNIIKFASCNGNKDHPAQKPTDLLEYLILTYTDLGQTVLDFTMGSGSTGVAAVNTGRKFIGIENDEKYFSVAKRRIESAKAMTHTTLCLEERE